MTVQKLPLARRPATPTGWVGLFVWGPGDVDLGVSVNQWQPVGPAVWVANGWFDVCPRGKEGQCLRKGSGPAGLVPGSKAPLPARGTKAPSLPPHTTGAGVVEPYAGPADAGAMDRWAKKQYGGWAAGLQGIEASSLRYFNDSGYKDINRQLRSVEGETGGTGVYHRTRTYINAMDQALAKAPGLARSTTLYRGVGQDLAPHLKEGLTFRDHGYVAATLHPGQAAEHARHHGPESVVMELTVPAGTRAASMDALGSANKDSTLLLGRGQRYRVTGRRKGPGGRDVVTAELLGR